VTNFASREGNLGKCSVWRQNYHSVVINAVSKKMRCEFDWKKLFTHNCRRAPELKNGSRTDFGAGELIHKAFFI